MTVTIKSISRPKNYRTVWPVRIDDTEWHLVDEATGDIIAMALTHSERPGVWAAALHKDFAVGLLRLHSVSFISDNPESALLGVLEENIHLARDILQQLVDVFYGIEHVWAEPVEEVEVVLIPGAAA